MLYSEDMTHYLTVIEEAVRAEIERETAEIRNDRDRAVEEYEHEAQMRDQEWREAHVSERIGEYRRRAYAAEEKLEKIGELRLPSTKEEIENTFRLIREILGGV
jgi:hypothetical protein